MNLSYKVIFAILLILSLFIAGCSSSNEPEIERSQEEPREELIEEDETESETQKNEEETNNQAKINLDGFYFQNITDSKINKRINSTRENLKDIQEPINVSVSGDGNPKLRVEDRNWTTNDVIDLYESIQLSANSSSNYNTTNLVELKIDNKTVKWSIKTEEFIDKKPDNLNFGFESEVDIDEKIYSNIETITGIDKPVKASVSGDGEPELRVNNNSWSSSDIINKSDEIQLRVLSSSSYDDTYEINITVGDKSDIWIVETKEEVLKPDSFSFNDKEYVEPGKVIESETIELEGFDRTLDAEVSGDNSPEIKINGEWVESGEVEEGDEIKLRVETNSDSFDEIYYIDLYIGDYSTDWVVETREKNNKPDSFSVGNKEDVEPGKVIESETIELEGFDGSLNVEISGDHSPKFKINNGDWKNSAEVEKGDEIKLKTNSSDEFSKTKEVTLKVGDKKETWNVITREKDETPNFSENFDNKENVSINESMKSNKVNVSDFDEPISAKVSGKDNGDFEPKLNINGTEWEKSGEIYEGNTIQLRVNKLGEYNTTYTTILEIGEKNKEWDVTTKEEPSTEEE